MQTRTGSPPARAQFDRLLFGATAILFPLLILIGFGRTYYLRGLFSAPAIPTPLVHVHGILMTLWVLLFIVQVRLIAIRNVVLHRRLGYASVALAAAIVITGIPTALRLGKYGSPSTPAGIPSQLFMIVPLIDLSMFVLFYGAAIWFRRRPAEHKRLILLTVINFLPPSLARIQVPTLLALGPVWFFGLPTLLVLTVLTLDARRSGRVNPVFLAGTILLIAAFPLRLALLNTAAWERMSAWLITLV